MNLVVRGSSLLIVSAIVAACAAQRDEGKATADQQGPPQPEQPQQVQQPATEEADVSLAKAEAYDRAIQEVVVTARKREETLSDVSAAISVVSAE